MLNRLVTLGVLAAVAWTCLAGGEEKVPLTGAAVIDFRIEGRLQYDEPKAGEVVADRLRQRLDPASYRVFSREQMVKMLKEDNLGLLDLWDEMDLLYGFARKAGIRYAVMGRVRRQVREWVVTARVVDCRERRVGAEHEATLPAGDFPAAVLDGLLKKLGLAAVPAGAGAAAPETRAPAERMRLVQARVVEAARLYSHPGGWSFDRPEPCVQVTVAMDAAALSGRRLTSQERRILNDAQLGDSVADVNHADFRLFNPAGEEKQGAGDYHVDVEANSQVADPYLLGYREIDRALRLVWKCRTLTARQYFYEASRPTVLVSVIFPKVGATGAAKIGYRDWPPVEITHVVEPLRARRFEVVPAEATRVVAIKAVEANSIYLRVDKWVVGPSAPALAVTVALKAMYLDLTDLPADRKAQIEPMPVGDWAAVIDPKDVQFRTRAGRWVPAEAAWFTGLQEGAVLPNNLRRATGPARLLWQGDADFKRTYYAAAPDAMVEVTVLFPRATADDVASVRYRNWTAVQP